MLPPVSPLFRHTPSSSSAFDRSDSVDRFDPPAPLRPGLWGAVAQRGLLGVHQRVRQKLRHQLPPDLSVRQGRAPGLELLGIVAHPDDHTMYFGGAIAKLTSQGLRVGVLSASHGESGRLLETVDGELTENRSHPAHYVVEVRDAESVAVADLLGHTHEHLYSADDRVDFGFQTQLRRTLRRWDRQLEGGVDGFVERLVREIRRNRPRVLVTTDPHNDPEGSSHGHHRALSLLVDLAARVAGDPEVQVDGLAPWAVEELLTCTPRGETPTLEIPVDPSRRLEALQAHGSQFFPEHLAEVGSRDTEGFNLQWRAIGAPPGQLTLAGWVKAA